MTTPPTPHEPQRPTWGQRTQLERISTDGWVLIATREGQSVGSAEPPRYELRKRGTGRVIHTLTPAMVDSLVAAGWLESRRTSAEAVMWAYRITQAGIAAMNAPWE